MTAERNLEVAKECGFFISPAITAQSGVAHRVDGHDSNLDAYTSRICADKDATIAEQAEAIKMLRAALQALRGPYGFGKDSDQEQALTATKKWEK